MLDAYGVLFAARSAPASTSTETLVKAAPMILTGLAVAVAFRAKFWNIGAEGQLLAGAVARRLRRRRIPMPGAARHRWLMVAGRRAGRGGAARWCRRCCGCSFKVDDVVSSLLLNSVVYSTP